MIIVSRLVLSAPEEGVLTHLGENHQGYVYKTNDLNAVEQANLEATISVIPQSGYKELRKMLLPALLIDRQTQEKIRAKYSLEAEIAALRTNDQEYRDFIEQVIAEHNAAKDALFSV